jgi:hypothetical protein|tara:strand:- start:119 stop:517 length:399 start_codon:yes stop_codon:yes gene_type:complete
MLNSDSQQQLRQPICIPTNVHHRSCDFEEESYDALENGVNAIRLSKHAADRCSARGIPQVAIDILVTFGKPEFHKGREIYSLDKKGLRKAIGYLGPICGNYSALLKDIYVVVDGNTVITAARKTTHHKRDRR